MKEKNLLASAALFSELYNNDNYTNIFDIIAKFIKGAIISEKKFSFNSTEITDLLEKIYEFQIPESVVRTTLNNRLKSEIERKEGYYYYKTDRINSSQTINEDYDLIIEGQNLIIANLLKYVEEKEGRSLDESEKNELFENFTHFLLDNGFSDKFSNFISAFIILNENDFKFKSSLNLIKEGIILYQGIKFTADINELGKWNSDITLYLNTEHLFNALGYNGVLFQEIFDDFYKLVNEINLSNKNTERRKIELRYFEETQREIDNFFLTAESIKKGIKKLDPSKLAMKMILADCENVSDVKAKRIKFDLDLKRKGIKLQEFDFDYSKLTAYNVEDETSLDELNRLSKEKGRPFDESQCLQYFKIFTKINYFRKGASNKSFEKIGHLFMTENGFAKYLAHHNLVKFGDEDTAFAKDIDFVTTRFWFKLKKGFSDKQALPKSFDVSTKARIILSSHLSNSISQGYQKLLSETKKGLISQEEVLERSYGFREKPSRPEDITVENVDDSLDFLNDESYFENLYREREKKDELLQNAQRLNEQLLKEIQKRDEIARELEDVKKEAAQLLLKESWVNKAWKQKRNNNWKDLGILFLVFLLNSFLAVVGIMVSTNSKLKEWISLLGGEQILCISIYAFIIVLEVLGRSYLFNKDRLKRGWHWFSVIVLFKYGKYSKRIKSELTENYTLQ